MISIVLFAAIAQQSSSSPIPEEIDQCVARAQAAFAGDWVVSEQRKEETAELRIAFSTYAERNEWRDPDQLILRTFEDGAKTPKKVIVETLTPTGFRLETKQDGATMASFVPVEFGCSYDASTKAHRLTMEYQRRFDNDLHDFRNEIEISERAFILLRVSRPSGTDDPYTWQSSLAGKRDN